MKIKDTLQIVINEKDEVWSTFFGNTWTQSFGDEELLLRKIYTMFRRKSVAQAQKDELLSRAFDILSQTRSDVSQALNKVKDKSKLTAMIQSVLNFFSEFSFEPNFRFINTLCLACGKSYESAKAYVANYFELTDNAYASAVIEKMKSVEFKQIVSDLHSVQPSNIINTRFQLHYGSAGTGKTTAGMQLSNNRCMVCHSAMLPSDLMEDFKFNEGKAEFIPSSLQIAMTKGLPIVLDEINLLPFESLRFLQTVLDGKSQFEYKGKTIVIKDGFKIIGTMNLVVNGSTYSLPEPLVDRCEEIKKYVLTAEDLLGAIS